MMSAAHSLRTIRTKDGPIMAMELRAEDLSCAVSIIDIDHEKRTKPTGHNTKTEQRRTLQILNTSDIGYDPADLCIYIVPVLTDEDHVGVIVTRLRQPLEKRPLALVVPVAGVERSVTLIHDDKNRHLFTSGRSDFMQPPNMGSEK